MIDVCIVIHRNYGLLDLQMKQWRWISGGHRLLVCDNTPAQFRMDLREYDINATVQDCQGSDGETHGAALDLLVRQSTSPIIGICDSDFFWTRRAIIRDVERYFSRGCQCVGVELWYDDFEQVNRIYPERAGYLCPCVFGMFIDRQLALSETFVVTSAEGSQLLETGWRIRKKIIEEHIKCHVYRARRDSIQPHPEVVRFGQPEIVGLHFLKGSNPNFGRDTTRLFHELALDQLYQSM